MKVLSYNNGEGERLESYKSLSYRFYAMKSKAAFVPLLLFFLLFGGSVHAVEFSSYKIVAEINGDTVNEDILITLFNNGGADLKSASITAPPDSEIISISDSYGDLQYRTSLKSGMKINFNFSIPVAPGETRLLTIRLNVRGLIQEKDDYFEYLLVFTPKRDVPDFEHVLKLPKDAELYSPGESFQRVVPKANLSRGKDATILIWKTGLEANEPEVFLVRFRLAEGSQVRVVLIKILGVVFIISVLGFFGNRALKGYRKVRTIDSLKIMNERERRVLEEIVKNEGIKQSDLLEKLGYTKASLSKILTKLESRGLIKKKKIGKVNKLYSGDKIR